MKTRTARQLSALAGDAYLAAANPAHWQHFLEQLVDCSQSRSARMLVLNRNADKVNASLKVNIDDADHRCYVQHFVNTCPWRPELIHKPPGRLYSTYLDFSCDQRQFYRTEFFNDWAGPQDIHHGACGTIYADADTTVQLLIQRTAGQGHYSAADTRRLNQLVPHVRQAMVLARELAWQRAATGAALQASQHSALPFLLLNEHGRIVHLSQDAELLINAGGPLALRHQRLQLLASAANARLTALIKGAASSASRQWRGTGGMLKVNREGAAPLTLVVTPVHPQADAFQLSPQAAFAAVFIHDPLAQLDIDPLVLHQLYGLTAAEARVVIEVVMGMDPLTVARVLGVSKHTVRSQLKSAFSKTGTSRQSEMTRLILTGPACRRPSAAPPLPRA